MRKFYSFITGIVFTLVLLQAKAQNDVTNFTSPASEGDISAVDNFNSTPENVYTDSCGADFNIQPANSTPLGRYFTALPYHSNQNRPTKVCWYFGDNRDTCIIYDPTNPPPNGYSVYHQYTQPGSYNVCVTITYDGGCLAYFCRVIVIGDPDTCGANFQTLSSTNNSLGKYFIAQPSHNHNKKPVRVCWNFGDGLDTCIQYSTSYTGAYAVYHLYSHVGNYNVCVNILYDGGCEANNCRIVEVGSADSCSANFEMVSSSANLLNKYFIAQPWNNHNKKPVQVCWNFGDGRDTCIQYSTTYTGAYAVNHIYAQPGNYNVCVTITYDGGCQAHYCRVIQAGDPDVCGANFQVLSVSSTALGKYFIAQPSHNHNKKPVRICWNFGDNRDTCIQYPVNFTGSYSVYHIYAHTGNYNVCVRINYDGGCEANYCRIVQVGDSPDSCSANFEVVAAAANPLNRYFIAQPWNNHNKKPIKVCWNFGDGRDTCIQYSTTFTGAYAVNHIYAQPGNYNVCVTIFYDGGCIAHYCRPVQVGEPDSCGAGFEVLAANANPLLKYFVAQPSHNHNKKPIRVCWNFGDGRDTCIQYSTSYTGAYSISHTYLQPGNYNVCVTILYDGGCEAHYCHVIQVGEPDSCGANFEIVAGSSNPLLRYFVAQPSHNHNKKPVRVCWNFGDGRDTCIQYTTSYTGAYSVSHTYLQPGNYNVCVTILYDGGCEAHYCRVVSVGPDTCSVQVFESTPSITSLTRSFYALPTSSNNRRVATICWYFGDGRDTCIVPSGINVIPVFYITHTYPGPGVYHPCVRVIFEGGCIAQKCIETVIRSAVDICGGYFTDSLTGPRTFKFHGQGIQNPNDHVTSYTWTFGDGTTAIGQDVTHTFNQGGTNNVCLLIHSAQGCETRICRPLLTGTNVPTLQLSPNPVVTNLHVVFMSTFTETVNIRIVNSNGLIVRTYTRNVVIGSNVWDFDLTALTPGIYSFVVQSPNQLASAIFLKQ
jgi:PKD repeat protein